MAQFSSSSSASNAPSASKKSSVLSRLQPKGVLSHFRSALALVGVTVLALVVAALMFRFFPSPLSTDAMDWGQVGRNISTGKGFSTSVVLPFAAPLSQGRTFTADFQHEPLFPLLAALAFVLTSPGDSALVALSLAFFVVSVVLLFSLAARLTNGNLLVAFLTSIVYIFSTSVLKLSVSGTPVTLSTALLLLLLLLLTPRPPKTDTATSASPEVDPQSKKARAKARRAQLSLGRRFFWAGLALGLCYLSNYMLLIPALVLAWIWVSDQQEGWKADTVRRFAFGFLLVSLPWWFRNFRLTGNPFYTLQWFELAMQTKAYPGQSLLANFEQGQSGSLVAVGPGFGEVARKIVRGLQEYFNSLPAIANPYLMPFVLVGLGIRSRFLPVERCRVKTGLVVAVLLMILGLSLLGRLDINFLAPFIPLFAFVGVSSLVELFTLWQEQNSGTRTDGGRADSSRSSAKAFGRTRVLAVLVLLALLIFPLAPVVSQVAARQNARAVSARATAFNSMGEAIPGKRAIISDVPQEVAWYGKRTSVLLPTNAEQLSSIEKIQPISALFLSDGVVKSSSTAADEWKRLYNNEITLNGYAKGAVSREGDVLYLKNPTLVEARDAVQKRPSDPDAYLDLGYAQMEANKAADARQSFIKASQLRQKWPQAFLGRGTAALRLGQYDAAFADFTKALDFAPRSLSAQLGIGDALLAKRQYPRAIVAYEKVLADYPDQLNAVNNLAYMYAQQGTDLDRALQMARRASQLSRGNAEVLDTLGWVCARTGRGDEAAVILTQAAQLRPNNGLTRYHLGKALLQINKKQDGYAAIQKALELGLPAAENADARRLVATR